MKQSYKTVNQNNKIKIICLFILSLIFLILPLNIFGQDQLDNFYYYEGSKVYLEVNKQKLSISFKGENAINTFNSIRASKSEIIEDKTKTSVIPLKENSNNNNHSEKIYYMELNTNPSSIRDYRSLIENYKKLSNVLMISPTYKINGGEFGLSNNFYVKLKHAEDLNLLRLKAKEMNLQILGKNKFMPLWFTLSIPSPRSLNALNYANLFYETGLFESTEPAFMYHNLLNTNDPYFNDQWTLKNTGQSGGNAGVDIKIEQAWNIATGSNIRVAVIDQGIQLNHPDLQSNISGTGYDAQTGTSPSQVRGAHGTACAGIIGAVSENNIGVAGVAPDSELMSISVGFGFGTTIQMLADGMNWSWQNGADIISNSWGGGTPSNLFNNSVTNALTNGRGGLGSIVVFSSGNSNVNGAQYPSNSNPLILCVGAIDRCGVRSGRIDIVPDSCDPWCSNCLPGSSFGTPLDVVAGGTSVPTTDRTGDVSGSGDYNPSSTSPPNNYSNFDYDRWFGGTSAACPFVSGVAALVLSANPNLTVQEVNTIIEQSAQKVRTDLYNYSNTGGRPNGTWNNELGYGLVNAYQALLLAQDCPDNLTIIQNVSSGQTDTQKAANTLTASNTIASGGIATYTGGQKVVLTTGFKANNGSSFVAKIEDCGNTITETIANLETESIQVKSESITIDIGDKNRFALHPNPTDKTFTITANHLFVKDGAISLKIYNTIGVLQSQKENLEIDTEIDVRSLPEGLYYIIITDTNGTSYSKRLVIKK
ncbi:S8 family serine peptidase [Aquimarina sp. RZ0]|uniref:S8 family serine peptidase n=1 Tax=Aquimarina sp. RZ0 TaxID=2607730 RepID=UPI0011F0EFCD|nr:S8 family serine peptidase [Aquimarina sp. RZ0]KAA1244078.1 S8 family serine peptidase [Aquimarina sp. RZ0]